MEIARVLGVPPGDVAKFGVWTEGNKVVTGVRTGTEPGGSAHGVKFRIIQYVNREIYAILIASNNAAEGRLVHVEKHGANGCPLVAVPSMVTDSRRDGHQFASPMESVFTLTPIINQIETLLSNVAAYNSIPRWVVEDANGNLVRDPDTGDPKMIASDPTVGLDPSDAEVVNGRGKQLTIDAAMLVQLLEFYLGQLSDAKPAAATEGQTGSSGPAWTVRQQLEAASDLLAHPVDNHAAAVLQIQKLWVHWMRGLDVPIYAVSEPTSRRSPSSRRGMIEFNPEDLIDSFIIRQDKTSASERTVLAQAGLELLAAGAIDDMEFYTEFKLAEDPGEQIVRKYVQLVKNFIMLGDTTVLQPGSLLWRVSQAVQGEVAFELMDIAPNFALGIAEQIATQAQAQRQTPNAALPPPAAGNSGGNPAEALGIRQAGTGASGSLPGSPAGREDEVRPLPVAG
jgi:hypothetical protein